MSYFDMKRDKKTLYRPPHGVDRNFRQFRVAAIVWKQFAGKANFLMIHAYLQKTEENSDIDAVKIRHRLCRHDPQFTGFPVSAHRQYAVRVFHIPGL